MNEFAQMFSSLIKISIAHRETTFQVKSSVNGALPNLLFLLELTSPVSMAYQTVL